MVSVSDEELVQLGYALTAPGQNMLLGHQSWWGARGDWDGNAASGEPVGEGTAVEALVGLPELELAEE